jgi:hypothetical protein
MAEVAEPLGVAGDRDAPVGQVEVVQGKGTDGLPAGSMDGGQGDDQPLPREGDHLLDGPDLVVGHRQQAGFRVGSTQPPGGVGEDQAALLGEPEQRPDRRDRGAERVPAKFFQPRPDVVAGDLPEMAAVG